ncbi:MAG: hypothetical protein Q4E55_07915 [Bacteroidales bacterium]|nr:hypothetical protein [Bacteroidales bacterium]
MSVDELLLRSRFQPLERILCYDVFDNGFNGWMTLLPNFTEYPDFDVPPTLVNKDQWPPVMLSSATFRYPGTHGSMSGTYSLKLSTRPHASPYCEKPAEGSMGHAIKRLSFARPGSRYVQIEAWFTYTAEQDKVDGGNRPQPGLHEDSIRAFGMGFDLQERGERYFVGIRYLNAVDGTPMRKWQYVHSTEGVTDKEWAFGLDGDWCKKGIDPWWFGRRYPNGDHDGFKDVPDGKQSLIYNETDCKLNWQYMRLKVNTHDRTYVEMQCQDRIWNLGNLPVDAVKGYNRIENLINPVFWVETDANRRVFLYIDSVVVSQE